MKSSKQIMGEEKLENEELSIFKRLVLKVDKTSHEDGYHTLKTFYKK